ncbi:kinase-like domain-containing protein [Gigaspora rosea]|uniref:Kinase-like domain-containing protein n=1 Tax=Gigaspora rosea TaxID=44941 RepID=A0A397VJ53_9GLOM|nr:kinase-like domain-containing protein [Gigaspora rosea]
MAFDNTNPHEGTLLRYSKMLQKYLTKNGVKGFDYSKFSKPSPKGKGETAFVYLTIFEQKTYALKSLTNNLGMDTRMFKKFSQEIINLHKIDHPNIIQLFGVSIEQRTGNFMLVLQYANGGNLREYLRRKQIAGIYRISWKELIQVAIEITEGLIYLHDKGIIHRDLHSKNILINDGRALISDFGLSKRLDDTSNSGMAVMAAYTDPHYLINGKKSGYDQKSDIYSLGVLFWELTSGIPPFYKFTLMALFREVLKNNREKIIDGTPSVYSGLYSKCWSFDPNERPALSAVLSKLQNLSTEPIEIITNIVGYKSSKIENCQSQRSPGNWLNINYI